MGKMEDWWIQREKMLKCTSDVVKTSDQGKGDHGLGKVLGLMGNMLMFYRVMKKTAEIV